MKTDNDEEKEIGFFFLLAEILNKWTQLILLEFQFRKKTKRGLNFSSG